MSRKEWLLKRRTGIGGSDVAAIMGVSPWSTPLQIYEEKLGIAEPTEENEAMKWGHLLEPVVVAEFERRTGLVVRPGGMDLIRHPDMPWLLATVDGLIGDDAGMEAKTARSDRGWGEPDSEEVPMSYLLQVQHYMIVTGRPTWWIAVLIGGSDFRIRKVESNPELADLIVKACMDFWKLHVEVRVPPAAQSAEEARRKFPMALAGSAVQASVEIIEATRRLATLKAEAKAIEAQIDAAEARIKDAMGTAEALQHGDQLLATWKSHDVERIDSKKLRATHPAIAMECTKTKSERKFLLKGEKE